MKKLDFPKNFFWGSAIAGAQVEDEVPTGGRVPTIWDHMLQNHRSRFYNLQPVKNDFMNNWKQDIKLAKDLGYTTLRYSIQWSRIFNKDNKKINKEGVEFYHKVFDEMIKNGIEPFVCLFHFDMPMWAQDKGGWESREVVEQYGEYAKFAINEYKSKVKCWFSFNEPIVPIEAAYQAGAHYPFVVSFKRGAIVQYHSVIAHKLFVKAFDEAKIDNGRKGIILSIQPTIPRSNSKSDLDASKLADHIQYKSFLDPIINGKYSKFYTEFLMKHDFWPKDFIKDGDFELIKKYKINFMGVNYYSPQRVKALDYIPDFSVDTVTSHTHFFNNFDLPNKRMNIYRGWEIYPKALFMILEELRINYGNIDCYVSENGMGVQDEKRFLDKKGIIQDDYRVDFVEEHLYWVHQSILNGSNVKGYHLWTYIDNWSWVNAYKNRYGHYSLNIETGERTPKKSATWIKNVINDCGFNYDVDNVLKD